MTFGDLSELSKYLKKAQTLNSKLDLVMEKVKKKWKIMVVSLLLLDGFSYTCSCDIA